MNLNFEFILFCLLAVAGVIALADALLLAPKRRKNQSNGQPIVVEYARSFFPVLLLVFSMRSFAFEPRRIPSGSLKPTLLVGDFILVNKFTYGIRLPVIHTKIYSMNEPKRGDIVVFREPPLESRDLVKRVIGVPGDHIRYEDKVLYINGNVIPQKFVKYDTDHDEGTPSWDVAQSQENLFGVEHGIYQILGREKDDFDVVVPQGKYFMMGDNRGDSADSRYWGFLPEENIIGRATHVIISFDNLRHPVRWNRIGSGII